MGRDHRSAGSSVSGFPTNLAPGKILAIMIAWIFLAEVMDMFMLAVAPNLPLGFEAFVDAGALLLFISPSYFLLYRPLKKHWQDKQRSEREIRFLSQKLLTAAEDERTRLAHDLHDEFGQVLTSLQFKMQLIQSQAKPDQEPLRRSCDEIIQAISDLGNQVRNISSALRPIALDQLGLVPALRQHVAEIAKLRSDLELEFSHSGAARSLPNETETALFRVCQESLHNVLRHANASRATVSLEFAPQAVSLVIEDNGIGFDLRPNAQDKSGGGIGLFGMRERMTSLSGHLRINSHRGTGTTIRAELPIPEGSK